jgi:predicted amidohydrolase YtcJ
MTMKHGAILLPIILALGSCSPSEPPADIVIRGGSIFTLNPSQPWAEALAIDGDTIRAVGTDGETERYVGKGTIVMDLDGRLVLPGFTDCDIDLFKGSFDLGKARLDEARSVRDIQDIILAYSQAHPEVPWILGTHWHAREIQPNRYDLDEVVPDRPVLIESRDGQSAVLNSKALLEAGIEIAPDTGEPTGLLNGQSTLAQLLSRIPQPSRDEQLEALRRGVAYVHRFGITSVHTDVGSVALGRYHLLEELEARDDIRLRVKTIFTLTTEATESEIDEIERLLDRHRGPWLKSGGVVIELDGEVDLHTAAMLEPYRDKPTNTGATTLTPDELGRLVERLDRRRIPITLRAKGDRAVRMALDALARVKTSESTAPRRHRLEGIDTIAEDDIPRLAALGITASIQPYRASPDFVSRWDRRLGAKRLTRAFAFKSLEESGARLAVGSHWPTFDLDPAQAIHVAVNRQNLDARPEQGWNPDERLTLEEAIAAYTQGGAYASSDDNTRGTLEAGKWADLVVLSEDPFHIPRRRIAEVEAVMTIVGGRPVYISPAFLSNEMRELLPERSYNSR